jgi:hypothetical protein
MTDTPSLEILPVEQRHRDAAAALIESYWPDGSDDAKRMRQLAQSYRAGHSHGAWVQAFARFERDFLAQPFDAHALANHKDFGGTSEAGFSGYYETDRNAPVIPAGMVPYGPEHPDYPNEPKDWDRNEPVMLSGGFCFRQADQHDPIYWPHDHDDIDSDVVAYTPLAPAPVVEGEWVIVPRHATHDMLAAAHDGPLMAADYTMEPKGTAWLQEMWAAFLSAVPGLDGRGEEWQPIETAPDDEPVQVRVGESMVFDAVLRRGASLDQDERECDQWVAIHEGEHPPCWTDGACWSSNADEVMSLQPSAWRRLPATLKSTEAQHAQHD